MEQEQRRVRMRERRVVGHRARAGDARVELAEINLPVVLIDQKIELEVAAIAFLAQLLAEPKGVVTSLIQDLLVKGLRENLVAAPAAAVGGELLEADELRH